MTRHEQVHAARESVDGKECIVSTMKGTKSICDRMHGADLALVLFRSKKVWCYIRRKLKERGESDAQERAKIVAKYRCVLARRNVARWTEN